MYGRQHFAAGAHQTDACREDMEDSIEKTLAIDRL